MIRRTLLIAGPLLVLLAAALLVFLRTADDPERPQLLRGGPLLDFDPATLREIVILEHGRRHRLLRGEGSAWSLRGDLEDWVDPRLLARRLAELQAAEGGQVLPGTEPNDRRYEFTGPDGVRMTMRHDDGREVSVGFGATNPVGFVYATGAGRPGCFPVTRETRDLVSELVPDVRVTTLLPPTTAEALDAIDLVWGGRSLRLARDGETWWLTGDGVPRTVTGDVWRDHDRFYGDRRRERDGRTWVRADPGAVRLLVHDVSRVPATRLVAPADREQAWRVWRLDEVWRGVVLAGPGVDPDPLADEPDRLAIDFSFPLDERTVPAVRRGLPLLAGKAPRQSLDASPSGFVDMRALDLRPLDADTLILAGAEGEIARAARDREVVGRFDGRNEWFARPAPPPAEADAAHTSMRNLVVDLDRLPLLAALPPTDDPRVLRDEQRLSLTLVRNEPPRRVTWHVGILDPARLPPGGPPLAAAPAEPGAVALWRPADGRLLQIPPGPVVTGRNLARRADGAPR